MKSRYISALIGGALALAVIAGLFWLIVGLWADADARFWQWFTETLWGRGFWPSGWDIFGASPSTYLFTGLIVGLVAFVMWPREGREYYDDESHAYKRDSFGNARVAYPVTALAVILMASSVFIWFGSRNDQFQSWEDETNIYVTSEDKGIDLNLQRLKNKGGLEVKEYSQEWEARVAPLSSAKTVMVRSSEGDAGSEIKTDSLTYTYGSQPGWTALRDGKKKQPFYGVAFWPGEGSVETCRFTGANKLNKSLEGYAGRSLLDEIAAFDKSLFFDKDDAWGYCNPAGDASEISDDQPVIIIPVKAWHGHGHRAVWHSAGVLKIIGSSSGDAVIEHIENVKANQFPGPVYSISLAKDQREESKWAAGHWNNWWYDFGFKTIEIEAQAGNSSEYLLRSKMDGHLYWVTPLTANSSDTEVAKAYSLIRADEATSGTVNRLDIYAFGLDDKRTINLEEIETRTRDAVMEVNNAFFANGSGGKLVEFLPLDDANWQVYATLNNRVKYRIVVPADASLRPQVITLDSSSPDEPDGEQPATNPCEGDLSKMENKQLSQCLSAIAGEFETRQNQK